jgi:hypothetical protein
MTQTTSSQPSGASLPVFALQRGEKKNASPDASKVLANYLNMLIEYMVMTTTNQQHQLNNDTQESSITAQTSQSSVSQAQAAQEQLDEQIQAYEKELAKQVVHWWQKLLKFLAPALGPILGLFLGPAAFVIACLMVVLTSNILPGGKSMLGSLGDSMHLPNWAATLVTTGISVALTLGAAGVGALVEGGLLLAKSGAQVGAEAAETAAARGVETAAAAGEDVVTPLANQTRLSVKEALSLGMKSSFTKTNMGNAFTQAAMGTGTFTDFAKSVSSNPETQAIISGVMQAAMMIGMVVSTFSAASSNPSILKLFEDPAVTRKFLVGADVLDLGVQGTNSTFNEVIPGVNDLSLSQVESNLGSAQGKISFAQAMVGFFENLAKNASGQYNEDLRTMGNATASFKNLVVPYNLAQIMA